MCNLYSITKSQQAVRDLVKAIRDITGNMPSLPGVFPNRMAPVVRTAPDGARELLMMRWGLLIGHCAELLSARFARAGGLQA